MARNAEKQREYDQRYKQTAKGRLSMRRGNEKRKRKAGPAGSPGPVGAAAQRERRARPEYRLAKRLGITVKVAREILGA